MTKSIQQFKLVIKDRLFYNRYEYAVGFHLDEVSCLRELNHARIDRMIERRIAWRDIAQQRTSGKSTLVGHTILTRRYKEITDTTVSNLHQLTEQLLTTSADFKLVVSVNTAHVYTNDLTLINQVSDLPGLTQKEYNRAVVGRPPNTIQLKNSTHKFRSYFKMIKLTDDQKKLISIKQPKFFNKLNLVNGRYYYDERFPEEPVPVEFALNAEKFCKNNIGVYPCYRYKQRWNF